MDNLHHLEPLLSSDSTKFAEVAFKCGAISEKCKEALDDLDRSVKSGTTVRYLLMRVCKKIRDSTAYQKFERTLSEVFGIDLSLIQERSNSGIQNGEDTVLLTEKDISNLTEVLHDVAPKWEQLGLALNLTGTVRKNCESPDCVLSLSNVLQAWLQGSSEPCTLKVLIQALETKTVSNANAALTLRQNYIEKIGISEKYYSKSDSSQNSHFKFCSLNMNVAEGKSMLIEAQYKTSEVRSFQWTKDELYLNDNFNYCGVQDSILMITDVDLAQVGKYQCLILDKSENIITKSDEIEVEVILSPERQYLMSLYLSECEPIDTWPPINTTKFINLALVNTYGTCDSSYKHTIRGDSDDIMSAKTGIEYREVFKTIKEGSLILVEGRPGSGKTTLARKICKDWAKDGSILIGCRMVFFIYLRLLTDKEKNLEDILGRLFYSDSSQREELNCVIHKLVESKGKKSCFVLDGLDEYDISNRKDTFIYKLIYKKFLQEATVVIFSRPVATHSIRSSTEIKVKRIEVLGFSKNEIIEYIFYYPFSGTRPYVYAEVCGSLWNYLTTHSNVMHMCYLPVHMAMICFLYEVQADNIPKIESKIYEMFTILTIVRHQNRESDKSNLEIESLKDLEGDLLNKFKALCKSAFENTASSKQILDGSAIPSDAHTLGLVTLDKIVGIYRMKNVHTFHHLTFQEYLAAWHIAGLEEKHQLEIVHQLGNNPHMKNVWKYYCGITHFERKMEQFVSLIRSHNSDTIYTIQCAFESQQESSVCIPLVQNQSEPYVFSFVDHIFSPYDMNALEYVLVNVSMNKIQLKSEKCKFEAHFEADSLPSVSTFLIEDYYKESLTDLVFLKKMPNLVELDIRVNTSILKLKAITLPFLKIIRFTLFANSKYCLSEEQMYILKFNSTEVEEISASSFEDFSGDEEENEYYNRLRCMNVVQSKLCQVFRFSAVFRGNLPRVSLYNCKIYSFSGIMEEHYRKCTWLSLINCDINNKLAKDLAAGLQYCINLIVLKLDFNCIEDPGALSIAVPLTNLKNLIIFSANGNHISDLGAFQIVHSLINCSFLECLQLQGNCISLKGSVSIVNITKNRFPKLKLNIWNKTLNFAGNTLENCSENVLELSGTHLSFVINCISSLFSENLQSINVSSTYMYLKDFSTLVSYLSCCKMLKKINLSKNCFFWSDAGQELHFSLIMRQLFINCPLLEYVDMSKNDLDVYSLSEMRLSSLKNLQYLNLSHNYAIFNFIRGQIEEISRCTNLHTLLLNGCYIDHNSLAYILKKCDKIRTLGLADSEGLRKNFSSFIYLLSICSELKDLNLGHNHFTQSQIMEVSALLDREVHLDKLTLSLCQLKEEHLACLCDFRWHCLHSLDVSWNSIGSSNMTALIFALKFCFTQLSNLNVCSNKIGDDAMVALQISLGSSKSSLLSLNIRWNQLGDVGIEILIQLCTRLECLDVSHNKLTPKGIKTLTDNSDKFEDLHYDDQKCD